MIKIDFFLAISLYLSGMLLFLLGEWILGSRNAIIKDISQDTKFILQCPICNFIYSDYKNSAFSICERCGSYIKKEEAKV